MTHPVANNRVDQCVGGTRICPNQACRALVFVLYRGTTVLASYPVARMDFDPKGVPMMLRGRLKRH
jgi:hypothetical protein